MGQGRECVQASHKLCGLTPKPLREWCHVACDVLATADDGGSNEHEPGNDQ